VQLLCAIVRYMYHADFRAPPSRARLYTEELVDTDTAFVLLPVGKKRVMSVRIHPWPSWLIRGSPKLVDFFLQFFYVNDLS